MGDKLRHDIQNRLNTIKYLTQSAQPKVKYLCEQCQAHSINVYTPGQMQVLQNSMDRIHDQIVELIKLYEQSEPS